MEAEKGIDFRISPNTSNCSSKSSCFRCKTEIIPHLEPMHCPNDTRVKNSSCLLCDGKCLELPELIEMKQNDKISHCRQDVTCCTISIMGILNNSCEGESYNCYSKDTHDLYKRPEGVPICVCSASNIAGNCTKPFSHQGECKCFKSSGIKLVDQDQMDECDNVSKDWKMCHTYMQEYNCLCERRTGIIDDIQPCQS
ncbi:uncharacterized protein LOC132725957 [Ruditapes philippinarum]|uniref:uncharacterized protein LOC132725957 n=1 Tax=Ruditapes philippinarum TaxID=129788 RepID=UPI00295BA0E1|nr:uncharacterized protein LOC132725957 [Ruditapes philippinarum]